ncbi:hypothetical protein [Bradyrhizobium zhanjiangense]|uniref:Uncharacterized protein n=1 Tax=Bradyrhizobium zhanjiangense TaxID=1325107 RepID=A0A4Q0Q5M6_9BRAD|nr:hypothetical protein [Bradyrhizobium zhanjiangense]RXG83526.1 hypothetical protein EAS61_42060 [Bradyrhizobium zhanjiangense]
MLQELALPRSVTRCSRYPDGKIKEIERTVEISPRDGYVHIEKLMGKELNAFDAFFGEVMDALIQLNFKAAAIDSHQV